MVPCLPFQSCCICLSSTCRVREDRGLAVDGHSEIIRKLTLKMYCLLSAAFSLGSAGTQKSSKPTGHSEICTLLLNFSAHLAPCIALLQRG